VTVPDPPAQAGDSARSGVPQQAAAGAVRLAFVPPEGRAVAALASIYATRMLGIFLVLPVLALYVRSLPGASPFLVGCAMGGYGLTQASLQIPLARLSDRLGRRPVIAAGLLLYLAGSVLGATAGTAGGVCIARLVQGLGAIAGTDTALLADLTRPEIRTRAMAFIGLSIGASFIVSLVAAPVLGTLIGVPGLFWVMAGLAVGALGLLVVAVPAPPRVARRAALPAVRALSGRLRGYYFGIFALHCLLQATFIGVPFALHDALGFPLERQWFVYLGVFTLSLGGTAALIFAAERSGRSQTMTRVAIGLLVVAQLGLAAGYAHFVAMLLALTVFFVAFNFLEARYPAGLSQAAGPELRATALGLFATAQFFGSFVGGFIGGMVVGTRAGLAGLFALAALAALAWWLLALRSPRQIAADA
jgi:MFS family permease